MRENTRCEVDEPISTPTDSTHSSSSSPKVRPVEEKKIRPPCESCSVMRAALPPSSWPDWSGHDGCLWRVPALSFLRQQAPIVALVIFGTHAVLGAFALHPLRVFLAQEQVLHVIGDGGAAFGNIHRRIVDVLFAGWPRLAARIVRTEPRGQPECLLRGAEMLMIPARPARRR